MKYVLIGAGPAGVRAAETLREEDPGASITLVSGEPGEPYARMAIPYILTGRITEDEFYQIECRACGGPGACGFMATANTMACIVETLGLTLPGCATLPALDPAREELCLATGRRIVDLVREGEAQTRIDVHQLNDTKKWKTASASVEGWFGGETGCYEM